MFRGLFRGDKGSPQLGGLEESSIVSLAELGGGSVVSNMLSVMTPPFAAGEEDQISMMRNYRKRPFTPHPRPKKPYKRAFLVTTVGRDNLEREILSDPDDPDLNIVFTLGMTFVRCKFTGSVTRAGLLLLEWAYLRGLEFTYREKLVVARAHWETYTSQGVAGEIYHLKRSRELYEQILELPEFKNDIIPWTEYLRVLMALGSRAAKDASQYTLSMAHTNQEQGLAEYNLYAGALLKEYHSYSKASTCLFESASLGPPKHLLYTDVMFLVARNVNEWDSRGRVARGIELKEGEGRDYSAVYQQALNDNHVRNNQPYEEWLVNQNTWFDIADKCAIHGLWLMSVDMLGQLLQMNSTAYADSRIWFKIAKAYFRAGRIPDALSSVTQALSLSPHNSQYRHAQRLWEGTPNTFEYTIHACSITEVLQMLPPIYELTEPAQIRLRQLHRIAVRRWDQRLRDEAEEAARKEREALLGEVLDDEEARAKVARRQKDKAKKNPRVLWRRPGGPIVYPTKLNKKILCAQVKDIKGELEYKPDLHDAPLPAGTHKLFVEFIPDNTDKYNVVEASVELVVDKGLPFVFWETPPFIYAGARLNYSSHLTAEVREEETLNSMARGRSPSSKKGGSSKKKRGDSSSKSKSPSGSGRESKAESRFGMVSRMGTELHNMGLPKGTISYRLEGPLRATLQPPGTLIENIELPVGTHTITATFTPADTLNYLKATTQVTVEVKAKVVSQVSWKPPPALTYLDKLDGRHLRAECDNSTGKFKYFVKVVKFVRRRRELTPEEEDEWGEDEIEEGVDGEIMGFIAAGAPPYELPTARDEGDGEDAPARRKSRFEIVAETELTPIAQGDVLPAGRSALVCRFFPKDFVKYTAGEVETTILCRKYPTAISWAWPPSCHVGQELSFEKHFNARLDAAVDGTGAGHFTYTATIVEYVPPLVSEEKEKEKEDEMEMEMEAVEGEDGGEVSSVGSDDVTSPSVSRHVSRQRGAAPQRAAGLQQVATFPNTGPGPHTLPAPPAEGVEPRLGAAGPGSAVSYVPPLLPKGHHLLHVVYAPKDTANFLGCRFTVPLTVRCKPLVLWAHPEFVRLGVALTHRDGASAGQLNATTDDCTGEWIYTPPAGTILEVGHYMLRVRLEPHDQTVHDITDALVPLTVVRKLVPTLSWSIGELTFGEKVDSERVLCCRADVPGTFRYNLSQGATVDSGTHAVIASFLPDDPIEYAPASTAETLLVHPLRIQLAWDPRAVGAGLMTIAYGTPVSDSQLCAFVTFPAPEDVPSFFGTMSYSVEEGALLPSGLHTLVATFTPHERFSRNYLPGVCYAQLEVRRFTPSLLWARPPALVFGRDVLGPQHLAAELQESSIMVADIDTDADGEAEAEGDGKLRVRSFMVEGCFSYVPALGEALPHAGTHILRCLFVPTDSFNFGSVEICQEVTVHRARPVVTWDVPAAIYWGATLSAAQLTARVECPGLLATDGEIVYHPPRGEVLPVGTHVLLAEFVPHDHCARNYDCSQSWAEVPLIVRPKPFALETLDRALLLKQQGKLHRALHSGRRATPGAVLSHPQQAPVRTELGGVAVSLVPKPTSAPYAAIPQGGADGVRRTAWPVPLRAAVQAPAADMRRSHHSSRQSERDPQAEDESDAEVDQEGHRLAVTFLARTTRTRDPNRARPLSAYSVGPEASQAIGNSNSYASLEEALGVVGAATLTQLQARLRDHNRTRSRSRSRSPVRGGDQVQELVADRRVASAESALSPHRQQLRQFPQEVRFPPLFDYDGNLTRPLTAQAKLEAAAKHEHRQHRPSTGDGGEKEHREHREKSDHWSKKDRKVGQAAAAAAASAAAAEAFAAELSPYSSRPGSRSAPSSRGGDASPGSSKRPKCSSAKPPTSILLKRA